MRERRYLKVLKIVLIALVALVVVTFAVMSLWNALVPQIFGLRAITFWQALGLLILSKLLFGGFRPGPGGHPRWRRRMMERWEQMSAEERKQFKEGIRRGCGFRPQPDVTGASQSEARA